MMADSEPTIPEVARRKSHTRHRGSFPISYQGSSPTRDSRQPSDFRLSEPPFDGLAAVGAPKPERRPGAGVRAPRSFRLSGHYLEEQSLYLGNDSSHDTLVASTPTEDEEIQAGDMESGSTALEKKLTAMSMKDPDLVGKPPLAGPRKPWLSGLMQVTWDMDDPEYPKNWTRKRKWAATFVVSAFTFISPVSSSMVAPALSSISLQFAITNSVAQQLIMSVFIIGYAIGPLLMVRF